jgi:hypothetical protein
MTIRYAASCAVADIMAAHALAVAGDTISVPGGTASWASMPTFTKAVDIICAGATITMTGGAYAFTYQPGAGTQTRFSITGFAWNLGGRPMWHLINTSSSLPIRNVRIHHNSFLSCGGNPTGLIDGPVFGVMDNCTTTGEWHVDNYCQDACADWADTAPAAVAGGADNFYYEDNHIAMKDCLSTCGHGGRYCYRHNTIAIIGGINPYPFFDHHGNQPSGVVGGRLTEIYENDIDAGGHSGRLFDHRGGQMMYWNNRFTNLGSYDYQIREEYCNHVTCANTVDFTLHDSYYWGNMINGSLFSPNAASVDAYGTCSLGAWTSYHDLATEGVIEGKKFWIHRAAFNGQVGMGVGTLAQRPSSGLVAGVAYWATDAQTLYRATGPTTWEVYYIPYTYPHPLRSESYSTPLILAVSSATIGLSVAAPTLGVPAAYTLELASAVFSSLTSDVPTLTPLEPMPWTIMLGPLGSETTLPTLNWPAGSSPEMPIGRTAYIDKVALVDGSVRYNFRTQAPREWTFTWERLTREEATLITDLTIYNEPLHFQNKWVDSTWHWAVIIGFEVVPAATTLATGGPFYKVTLSLQEVL